MHDAETERWFVCIREKHAAVHTCKCRIQWAFVRKLYTVNHFGSFTSSLSRNVHYPEMCVIVTIRLHHVVGMLYTTLWCCFFSVGMCKACRLCKPRQPNLIKHFRAAGHLANLCPQLQSLVSSAQYSNTYLASFPGSIVEGRGRERGSPIQCTPSKLSAQYTITCPGYMPTFFLFLRTPVHVCRAVYN